MTRVIFAATATAALAASRSHLRAGRTARACCPARTSRGSGLPLLARGTPACRPSLLSCRGVSFLPNSGPTAPVRSMTRDGASLETGAVHGRRRHQRSVFPHAAHRLEQPRTVVGIHRGTYPCIGLESMDLQAARTRIETPKPACIGKWFLHPAHDSSIGPCFTARHHRHGPLGLPAGTKRQVVELLYGIGGLKC